MSADRSPREAALDLVWSLWSECGVPGPRRAHARAVVDPELLLVVTPWAAAADDRLLDLVFSWCRQHGERLSASRVAALVRGAHPEVREPAEAFLAELTAARALKGGVPGTGGAPARTGPPRDVRPVHLQPHRPALLRFRARALAGVGGRAEVLVRLLADAERWQTSATLDDGSMARRHIARILSELGEGGVVAQRARGNTLEYRLMVPAALRALVGASPDLAYPDWGAVFAWLRLADALAAVGADRPATLRVELARAEDTLAELALTLGLELPRGGRASDEVLGWVRRGAIALAEGRAGAFGVGGIGGGG